MIYTIGEVLRDLRISRGYTQEELCYGICSRGNLSKIETANRIPRWYTIEALIHRLGESPVYFAKFVKKEEQKVFASYKYIINCMMNGILPEKGEINNIENYGNDHILILQLKKIISLLITKHKDNESDDILNELIETIKMTMPDFDPLNINKCYLLSYVEIFLLYYIGIYLYKLDNRAEAWKILLWLKDYAESKIIDLEERVKIHLMIIYRESLWTKLEKRYKEAVELCDLGILYCVKYDKISFLVRLLCLKSDCLNELKSFQEAEKYSVQARTLSEIMHFY